MKKANEQQVTVALEVLRILKPGWHYGASMSGGGSCKEELGKREADAYEAAIHTIVMYLKK